VRTNESGYEKHLKLLNGVILIKIFNSFFRNHFTSLNFLIFSGIFQTKYKNAKICQKIPSKRGQ